MAKHSAGILLYRRGPAGYEVLLVHPGGPFWAKKDLGAWSLPKGEFVEGEEPLLAAKREFEEEVGSVPPDGEYKALGEVKNSSGKIVQAFALEADLDLTNFKSNTFEIEWPPKSGKNLTIPENDKAEWIALPLAKQKLMKYQAPFIDRLAEHIGQDLSDAGPPQQAALF